MRAGVRDGLAVFITALAVRLAAVVITSVTALNPYSKYDADGFAASAAEIAHIFAQLNLPALNPGDVYDVWGALLAPFWLIPGSGRLFGRVAVAVLGAAAVYNVFVIVRYHWSRRAGLFAVAPMCLYPSYLLIHATVLREAMVLFGLTTATRLLLAPHQRLGRPVRYTAVGTVLVPTVFLRPENVGVYVLVLATGAAITLRPWKHAPSLSQYGVAAGAVGATLVILAYGHRVLERLVVLRRKRARGRTEYLGSVLPDTVVEAVAFSWTGALYFLFTPFPWMVTRLSGFVVAAESAVSLWYALFALRGARLFATRTLAGGVALVVGFVVGVTFYGLGTVNVGTAVRHRQMVLWVLFLFGGVGLDATLGKRES